MDGEKSNLASQTGNPFDYLLKEFNLKDLSNISVDRLERFYKASKDVAPAMSGPKKEASSLLRELKSNEMITLSVIRSSHETGTVKKVLHAPTMRLFAVKVI
ncbi:MAG: hypothetical protein EOP55_16190 [Sphingobacteriales bacterium]|nr:MAG: hypothetical protein EOP55_16190 [Sphingobacteriales bacterium]